MRSTIISPIVAVLAGVTIAMAQPPAAPTLSSPANGATNVALNPTLTWDSSAGASHYQLQVAKDSSFNSIVFSDSMLTSTSRAISSLVNSTTYYWRVRASNTGGTSAWSADWRFTTVSGLPGTPTLVSPSNGQTNVSTNPMMTWNSAAGAATYRLQVATDSTFATTIFDDSTLTLNSRSIGPLTGNITYYWRVNAKNPSGTGAWSTIWSFVTASVPVAPVLVSPANGATNVALNPTLTWDSSTGAIHYQLQVAKDSSFHSIVLSDSMLTSTSRAISSLVNSTTYYWRVRASNASGTSAWSADWRFTTVSGLPGTPTLVSPANGQTGVSTNPMMTWNSAAGAATYRLQVATDSTFATTIFDDSTLTLNSRSIGPLAGGNTTYYWRVNAKNPSGTGAWSTIWSFVTATVPAAPVLVSPANNATNVSTTPTLAWNVSTGASHYQLQVATDSSFHSIIFSDSTLDSTFRTIGPLANSTAYYWHVRASNAGGASAWSSVWRFTTAGQGLAAPILLSPVSGATGVSLTPTLAWNASAGAANYQLEVATDSSFNAIIVFDSAVTSTSTAIGPLVNSTAYYWRVRASNAGGTSAWSSIWRFTTVFGLPGTPVLVSPTNGQRNISTSPTMMWNSVAGAATYRLQVSTIRTFATTVFDNAALTGNSVTIGPLVNNRTYYWRVSATNPSGTGAWSTIWSFATASVPAAPVLVSPVNGARNVALTPTLKWNASAGATNYQLEVAIDNSFTTIIISDSLSSTSIAIGPLVNSTTYYWRVSASNAGGTSAWSAARRFTTVFGLPGTPVLVSPANGQTGVSLNPAMMWNSVTGAATYRLQVSTVSNFATTVFDNGTLTVNSIGIGPLAGSTTYYWRVNAKNPSGTSAWSTTWSFTTATVPVAPVLVSPVNGATNVSTNPMLAWNASAGASSYMLLVATDSSFTTIVFSDSAVDSTSRAIGPLADSTAYYWRVRASSAGGTSAWSSIWRFTTGSVNGNHSIGAGVAATAPGVPRAFSITGSSGTVRYALANQCHVSLKYYDLRGRLAASFVNSVQAPGYYSLSVKNPAISRGSYIRVFEAGNFVKREIVAMPGR